MFWVRLFQIEPLTRIPLPRLLLASLAVRLLPVLNVVSIIPFCGLYQAVLLNSVLLLDPVRLIPL